MDDLPTLLPMWHSISLKSVSGIPHYGNDATIFPDHTGVGVDISFKHGFRECIELKSSTVKSSFAAKSCAMPFLPPNKVKSLHDPCMQSMKSHMKKQADFCTKLDVLSAHVKRGKCFHDSIYAAESTLSSLNNIEECDKLSIPKSVMELAEAMPEHFSVNQANWRYTNGCIATLPYADREYAGLIFHPSGPKMNRLNTSKIAKYHQSDVVQAVWGSTMVRNADCQLKLIQKLGKYRLHQFIGLTPIKETSKGQKSIVACEEDQRTLKLSGGRIYQIEAAEVQGTRMCCVRQEKTYHFVNLDTVDENEDPSFESFSLQQEISSISMSPFEAGQHVITTKDGILFIQDANKKTTLWQLEEPLEHDAAVSDMWWGCSFGRSCPSVLCMDHMNLLLYDLRRKKKPIGIFSSSNPFMLKDEQLMVFQNWPGNDYQHLIASDHHLVICDIRYPEQPVLLMNHMMEGFPIYSSVAPYSSSSSTSEHVVLLGSQEKQEVASFFIQSSTGVVQPFSLGPPLHLSGISDCVQSVRLQGHAVDELITKRLSVPLIGVCAIPRAKKLGFTALQLSSLGDMFYQCFQACDSNKSEKTWKVSPGCVLTHAGKIFPKLNDWMDQALVEEKSSQKTWSTVDKSDILSRILVQKAISSQCRLCKDKIRLEGQEIVDSEICPSCGLESDTSQRLMDAMKHGQIIVQPSSKSTPFPALNLIDLSKSSGPLSKKLLKVWEDTDFMPSKVIQHEEALTQTLITSNESTEDVIRKSSQSGTSVDEIIYSVHPANVLSDSDRSSCTPSVDGLIPHRAADGDEDVVVPSQAIQPLVGETLRTPKSVKKPKLYSSAGF